MGDTPPPQSSVIQHQPLRLRVLEGPNLGEVFALPSVGSVRLGRGPGNAVRLDHPSLSREHLLLETLANGVMLRDLGSQTGTRLNGQPLTGPATIGHGDELELGVYRLVLERDTPPADADLCDEPGESAAVRVAAEIDLGEARPCATAAGTAEIFYRLSEILLSQTDPDRLADQFLEQVLAALPGDSASLVAVDPLSGRLEVRRTRDRLPDPADASGQRPRITRTLVTRCIEERRALLVDNAEGHPALGGQTSVRAGRIGSVMAAPLLGRPAPCVNPSRVSLSREGPPREKSRPGTHVPAAMGAVCLISRRLNPAFNAEACRLLATMANLGGLALAGSLEQARLKAENQALRGRPALAKLITADAKMRELLAGVLRVAVMPTTVLILGETGTGKELIAEAIHQNSLRCNGPLVKVNCAAVSESLLESELFGHEPGAFTDARTRRIGKLESAHRGTLLLDEVGEMSPTMQAKLLRAVEQREFHRLGGNDPIRVDVRFVAATHRDLTAMVAAGKFREDLYYRLGVMPIRVPPLRARPVDVPLLAEHFLREFAVSGGSPQPVLSAGAIELLCRYHWPGNVRELRNLMERLSILHPGGAVGTDDVADAIGPALHRWLTSPVTPSAAPAVETGGVGASGRESLAEARARFESEYIARTLADAGGNISEAARRLGLTREALSRRLSRTAGERNGRVGPSAGPV